MKHVFCSIFVILLALVTVTAFGDDVEADVDDDPLRFEEGDNVERSVPENGRVYQGVGAPVTATGGNGEPLKYSLAEGEPQQTDGFLLNDETGQLVAVKVFNYEESSPIEVTLSVTDGESIAETTVQISITNVNEAPRFAQHAGIRTGVMGSAGTAIGEPVSATDPDLTDLNADANPDTPEADPLTYTLGGEYANLFDIDSMTGQLRTIPPANYGGIPGPYIVTVTVSDGHFTHATTIYIFLNPINILELATGDETPPEVRISVPDGVQNSAFDVVITFTEVVSDFEQTDVTLSGTSTAGITGWLVTDDTIFTATITPTTSGDVVVSVRADVATDAASNNNTASESQTVTVDVTSPEVRISVPDGVQNSEFNAVITFTEVVSDFEQADVTLSGTATASITGWLVTDDTIFTATITPTTSGDVVVSVRADVATDAANNNNTASESQTVTVDVTSPEVRISVPDGAQKTGFDVVITFTERVSGFEQADVTLSGTATASITGGSTTDDTVFTARITPTTSGEVVVSVGADVATDAAGNNNTASGSETVTVDMTPPEVSISVPAGVQNSAFNVVITFTEEVSDFEQADLTLSGTATASITGWSTPDNTVFTARITPTTSGTLTLNVMADVARDAAVNLNTASEAQTITVDMPLEVSVSVPEGVQNSAFNVVITFTEVVSDFEQADVTLSGTATAGITGWLVTDDTVFTATITPTTSGEVVVSVMADVATDAASNNNTASDAETVTVDITPPEVSVSVPAGVQNFAFNVVITFTEEVSDFEPADLTLSGTATASIAGWSATNDTVFTAAITPTTSGEVVVSVMAGVATDAASNNNTASDPQTVTVDIMPPEVSVSVPAGAQNSAFNVVITFTEEVSDFEQTDLTLSGTATASITEWATTDDTVFTATITPTTSGDVVVSVRAEEVATVTVDMTPPEVSISVPEGIQNAAFDITIAFTEVVAGFEQTDVMLSGTSTARITRWATPDDTVWMARIIPATSGTLTLSIAEGAVTDTAGNTNVPGTAEVDITLNVPDDFVSVCDRTPQVRDAIVAAVSVGDCADVTAADLASITKLNLGFQKNITALKANDFSGLTALVELFLYSNELSSLPAGIFDDLTALKALSLSNNALSSLPEGIFDDLTALERLYLYNNELSSLPAGIFDHLTALVELYLYNNTLSSLPAGIFDHLTALVELSLYNNALSSLPAGIFDHLTALVELSLHVNTLSSLPADLFDELITLEVLNLYKNKLISLPEGIFDHLIALEQLYLYNNALSRLPDGIFDNLTTLIYLNLSNNALSSLPEGIFDKLTKLWDLKLSNNALSSLPDGIFAGLTALEWLDLSGNTVDPLPVTVSLKRVEEGQFKATAPTGAPFDIALRLVFTNGILDEAGPSGVTISGGTVESETATVTRTPGTVDAVTVDIGTLPDLPDFYLLGKIRPKHSGYALVRSSDLPLTVIEGLGNAAPGIASEVVLPNETTLSANYPNPFNPETWIPYQLANPSDVVISIYDGRGQVVRRLALGHQPAGYYTNRSRAAYWDGRNDFGERVSSGLYFYQLKTDTISVLRKMVILK